MRANGGLPSVYRNRWVVLATKHEKQRAVSLPMRTGLGLEVAVPGEIDTDALGTFTGEIARAGHPRDVAVEKARLGMNRTGLSLGMASEGSFGPHPHAPFVAGNQEVLVFVDEDLGIKVAEQVLTMKTNFAHQKVSSCEELRDFLQRVGFPSHGLVVRPDTSCTPGEIEKGITTHSVLRDAFEHSKRLSENQLVHVETDMRAHVNPTRMRTIRRAALKLARRLRASCSECAAPGWGIVGTNAGLPCRLCDWPTELVKDEVYGCPKCEHRVELSRQDGLEEADPGYCPLCNP